MAMNFFRWTPLIWKSRFAIGITSQKITQYKNGEVIPEVWAGNGVRGNSLIGIEHQLWQFWQVPSLSCSWKGWRLACSPGYLLQDPLSFAFLQGPLPCCHLHRLFSFLSGKSSLPLSLSLSLCVCVSMCMCETPLVLWIWNILKMS